MDTPCIYIMYWDISNPYIGQTVSFNKRKNSHYNSMKRGDHDNFKIQTQYIKRNTLPNIEILEYCNIDELNNKEEYYITEFDSITNGLNIISGGYSVGIGIHNPASLYSEEQLLQVLILLAEVTNSYKKITEITKVPKDTITKIASGVQHIWLKEKYPEEYERMKKISTKERYKYSASAIGQNKNYKRIRSPEGVIFTVTNTLQFSKEHDLPNGNLCSVLLGKRKSVKGWYGVD